MTKLLFLLLISFKLQAQFTDNSSVGVSDDDLNDSANGDIFSDFSEDLESGQILDDERFFRYGRFYSVNLSLGLTTFDGNRGLAYENEPPTYGLSTTFFFDFQTAFVLGVEFSKHNFVINNPTAGFGTKKPGLVEVNMLRPFFGVRYYIDTSDLGTAITYSNPYVAGRIEYWYQSNKFIDDPTIAKKTGGGIGAGLGMGLEFPIELKKSYISVEVLFHAVNFFDKYTQDYRPPIDQPNNAGYQDFTGYGYSTMVSYVMSY